MRRVMLLTLTTTRKPALDLGYLLHKNPSRCQAFALNFGRAHVFYPEASDERCTAALLLDVDPIGLVRRGNDASPLAPYVNDRPYVASSFLSVALAQVFGSALSGRCKDRPEAAAEALPLEATLAAVPCRGGEGLLRRLFEPLGYTLEITPHAADLAEVAAEPARLFTLTVRAEKRLRDLLAHLYVLIPVLDDDKHYWVGDDEVDKLLRHGEGWLATHPARELITLRYLKHRRSLARSAMSRLTLEEGPDPDEVSEVHAHEEEAIEAKVHLNDLRLDAVVQAVKESGGRTVVDLGCGEGKLVKALLRDRSLSRVVGVDVSQRALEIAAERLEFAHMTEAKRARVELLHGSLFYRDARFSGFDVATVVEVIEHLDPPRLEAFRRVVFQCAAPPTVIVTTPNVEYNVTFDNLAAGKFRHKDHRFEWTRQQFQAWAEETAQQFGYQVSFRPIGPELAELGAPTQMAVFAKPGTQTAEEAS